jgi:hypothetical protein
LLKIEGEGSKHDLDGTAEWPADMFEGVPKFTFGKIERVSKGEEGGMMKFNIYFLDIEKGGIERYVELLKEAGRQAHLNTAGPWFSSGQLVETQKDEQTTIQMRNDSLIFALVIMASFSPKDFRPTMEPPLTGNYYIPPPTKRTQAKQYNYFHHACLKL